MKMFPCSLVESKGCEGDEGGMREGGGDKRETKGKETLKGKLHKCHK